VFCPADLMEIGNPGILLLTKNPELNRLKRRRLSGGESLVAASFAVHSEEQFPSTGMTAATIFA
jgi:hypothetical protein